MESYSTSVQGLTSASGTGVSSFSWKLSADTQAPNSFTRARISRVSSLKKKGGGVWPPERGVAYSKSLTMPQASAVALREPSVQRLCVSIISFSQSRNWLQ